jgi:hypothetical protein
MKPSFVDFKTDIKRLTDRGLKKIGSRTESYDTSDYKGGLVLSYHKNETHIEPEILVVKNIRELKELNGMPDEVFTSGQMDNHHEVPPAFHSLNDAEIGPRHKYICNAISTFLYGNSQLVSSYEDKINELRFPLKVAIFSGKDVIVRAGSPLIIKGTEARPFAAHFDNVTVEPGAKIECVGPGKLSAQNVLYPAPSLTNAAATPPTPGSFLSLGGDGGDAGAGGPGGKGTDGGPGTNGAGDKHSCTTASGKGGKGQVGLIGGTGSPGGPGGDANEINFSTDSLTGTFVAGSIGGNGGNGGKGGPGGKGGNGGPGGQGHTGTDKDKNCGNGPQGDGGDGGPGGPSGDGGKGGNGNKIYINWASGSPSITGSPLKANGGNGADGGAGGKGGSGSTPGNQGPGGKSGSGGAGGRPGHVIINGPSSNKIL